MLYPWERPSTHCIEGWEGPRVREAYKNNNNNNNNNNNDNDNICNNNNNQVIRLPSVFVYICTPNPQRAIKTVKTPPCSSCRAVQPDTLGSAAHFCNNIACRHSNVLRTVCCCHLVVLQCVCFPLAPTAK